MTILPLFIVELSDQNDREMMGCIYEKYHRYMYATAYRILKDRSDAEDVLQECWMSWCNPHDLEKIRKLYQSPGCELRHFVAGCTRNKCFTLLHNKKRRMESLYENEAGLTDAGVATFAPSVEETVELRHEVQEAFEGIRALPPYQRRLMWMRYIDEQTTNEIAAITGMTTNAINAVLSKAKKRLRLDIRVEEDAHGETV